jgi:hypothetical protein
MTDHKTIFAIRIKRGRKSVMFQILQLIGVTTLFVGVPVVIIMVLKFGMNFWGLK